MFLWITSNTKSAPATRRNRPLEEEVVPKQKSKATSVKLGKIKVSTGLVVLGVAILLVTILALVNRYQQEVTLSEVKVNINAASDNAFMNETRVMEAMGWIGGVAPLGTKLDQVSLKMLEDSLLKSPFVKDAELYKNIQGTLLVDVEMRKPVARLMNNSGADIYLDASGVKFPVSTLHSANVLLVRGDFEESVADTFSCETVLSALPVLTYIRNNPFWNNYLSEVSIGGNGELMLYPRMDNMEIEFGHPIRTADKLRNLQVFLEEVMTHSDRPRFKQLSVKYKGQVVATKR